MELTHTFTVAAPIDQTWTALNDIESVAGCFPGAAITSTDGDSFTGTCKVKLGPIALVYNGSGSFVEKNETTHTMKIDAKGKDKRGNGTAGAQILATLSDIGGQTHVHVITDLAITGRPAQFGRGVMQDVSDKLLSQFVGCLQDKVGVDAPVDAEPVPATQAPSSEQAEPVAAQEVSDTDAAAGDQAVRPRAGQVPHPAAPAPAAGPTVPASGDDALDLGGAVLPVLLKTYWKPAVALGVALGVIAYVAARRTAG